MQTSEKAKGSTPPAATAKTPANTAEARSDYNRKCDVYTKTVDRCNIDLATARASLDALEKKCSREMDAAKNSMLDARDVLISFEAEDTDAKKAG